MTQVPRTVVQALTRFRAPTAQPSRREPPLPGLRPTRVTLRPHAYHASRRFSPSTASLVLFQPGALTGFCPSELDLAEVARTSRREQPLLRLTMPDRLFAGKTVAGALGVSARGGLASGVVPLAVGLDALDLLRSSSALALLGFASSGLSPSVPWPPGPAPAPSRELATKPSRPCSER